MKIKDLKAKTAVDEIVVDIVSKGETKSFANDRGSGKFCNCAAKDDSGEVSFTLWNEQIDEINEGDKIMIQSGWVSEYKGRLQLSTGKKGSFSIISK